MKSTQAYPIGTVVFVNSFRPIYGIVIDREHWLKAAFRENQDKERAFLRNERAGVAMIPLLIFGDVVGKRSTVKEGDPNMEIYFQRYEYSNVGGDIHIISGGVAQLLNIIWHIRQFTKGSVEYVESTLHDIKALGIYLNGGYDIDSDKFSLAYISLIKLYEMALPGLSGKDYCGT